tara:strand:- start:1816 stop:2439 length:624 start_codon:yes stop_codon:yes gene_type:complete
MASQFDDIRVSGTITVKETGISTQTRATILRQDANAIFPVNMMDLRVWDAIQTNLPGTAATDDLALIGTTFGTTAPVVTAGDVKTLASSRYARFMVRLPECYEAGETVTLSLSAGMVTTVASVSCTVDVEAYKIDKIGGISADLCTTAAATINSLVFGSKSFLITPSALVAGDVLDVRITIAFSDSATGTAVTPTISGIDLLCDIKG